MSNYTKQAFEVGEILKAAKLNAMDDQIAALSENPGVTREEMEAAIEEAIEEAINEAILNTMNTPV